MSVEGMVTKTVIDEDRLAVRVEIATRVVTRINKDEEVRQYGFTTGFPLEWDIHQINAVMDKLNAVLDREQNKSTLKELDFGIKVNYQQLNNVLGQQEKGVKDARDQFVTRGKLGDFTMNDKQRADFNNHETSIKSLRETIAKQEQMLEELRERCR